MKVVIIINHLQLLIDWPALTNRASPTVRNKIDNDDDYSARFLYGQEVRVIFYYYYFVISALTLTLLQYK